MRLTNKLCAQHLGWHFKKHWQIQGKRIPRDTGAAAELQKLGIAIKDPQEVVAPKVELPRVDVVGYKPTEIAEDATHPNWHQKCCHIFGNGNVLLEGIPQAQLLTKAIEINGFPKNIVEAINHMQLPSNIDRNIQHSIMASHVYDAEQVKLPKIKLPDRPAYNLPRDYGVSHERRNRLLINKFIFECEKLAGRSATARRKFIDNADFKVTLTKDNDLLQFGIGVEKLITSTRALEPVKGKYDAELPDLYPLKYTITIPKKHIYAIENFYPLGNAIECTHPHTIFLHFNKEFVGNLHESRVTTTQFQSRTLLKAFAVAAARAKQIYGDTAVNHLPKPIVVQSIQTDGHSFHFGIFQLNTLILDGTEGLKNYWFHETNMNLFSECGYQNGRPYLKGYNKDVFRCINAFYNS